MESGILMEAYGRELLKPCLALSAESMGINYNKLDKNKAASATEAGEMYSKLGGMLSHCRCKKDCSIS
jgi:hypothetical protein